MPSKGEVIERLRRVIDPEIGMSIVDLDMVRSVEIVGENVVVTVALTVQGCQCPRPFRRTFSVKFCLWTVSRLCRW